MPSQRRVVLATLLVSALLGCPDPKPDRNPVGDPHEKACVDALRLGDLDVAEARCSLCLEYARKSPECTNNMGLVAMMRGDFGLARDYFKRTLRIDDDFAEARVNLGVVLMQEGSLDDAKTLFHSALKINPGYKDARWNLTLCSSRMGDASFIKTQRYLQVAGANTTDPRVLKAAYADAEAHYQFAETHLRRLHELDPTQARVAALRGYLEMQRTTYAPTENHRREHLKRAASFNTRCLELAAADSKEAFQCRGNLAAVQENLAQCQEAMGNYLGCLALVPGEPECLRGMERTQACVAIRSGVLQHALAEVARRPADPQAHQSVCAAAFQAGLDDLAAASCENAVQLDASLCAARELLAAHYVKRADADRTIEHCTRVLGCAPLGSPSASRCKEALALLAPDGQH